MIMGGNSISGARALFETGPAASAYQVAGSSTWIVVHQTRHLFTTVNNNREVWVVTTSASIAAAVITLSLGGPERSRKNEYSGGRLRYLRCCYRGSEAILGQYFMQQWG